jgi:hypothetical protein
MCKSLQDEIVIKDKKIKIQQDEIKNLQTTVTKLSTKPAQKTIKTVVPPLFVFTVAFSFKVFVLMSLVIELPMMSTFPVFF